IRIYGIHIHFSTPEIYIYLLAAVCKNRLFQKLQIIAHPMHFVLIQLIWIIAFFIGTEIEPLIFPTIFISCIFDDFSLFFRQLFSVSPIAGQTALISHYKLR